MLLSVSLLWLPQVSYREEEKERILIMLPKNVADVRSRICAADGLSPLLALLKPEEEMVTVEHATSILSRLAKEYSTKTTLLSLSAHQQLLPLITGEDANVQRHALETLEQLVELFHARRAVAEDGGK